MLDGKEITHDTLFESVETSENLSNESKQTLDPKIVSVTPKVETEIPVETSKVNEPESPLELETDKPKKDFDPVAHFQSIADKRLTELERIKLEKERLETELNQLKNPIPKVEPLQEPVEPVLPQDYDPLDIYTKGTTSFEYEQKYKQYLKDITKYNKSLMDDLKNEKKQLAKVNEASQAKAAILSEFTGRGRSIEDASKIFDWSQKLLTPEWFTPENLLAHYDFENNKTNPQVQLKNNQIDQRNERTKMVVPPNLIPSEAPKVASPDDEFNKTTFRKADIRTI